VVAYRESVAVRVGEPGYLGVVGRRPDSLVVEFEAVRFKEFARLGRSMTYNRPDVVHLPPKDSEGLHTQVRPDFGHPKGDQAGVADHGESVLANDGEP